MKGCKEAYYFTGRILALDEGPVSSRRIVKNILTGQIDWKGCVELWSEHLVIPAIYLRFKNHGWLNDLPSELLETLAGIYKLNRARNAAILQQVEHLRELLDREQIYPVFLKGTGNLLDGLYSDLGERMIHDIDFLVPGEDYLRTAFLLQASGYCHHSPDYVDFSERHHFAGLYKEGEPALVEIHRMPVSAAHGRQFPASILLRDKQPARTHAGVYVPCDRHKLIHTFIHNQLSDKGHAYQQSSFRSFNDLLHLSKRIPVFTLPTYTPYRRKAISWLVHGQRLMGLEGRFYPFETKGARWYCRQYDLALTYTGMFQVYRFIQKLVYLLFVRYGMGMVKAIYQKKQRVSVYRRLKSASWYGAHVRSFREYF